MIDPIDRIVEIVFEAQGDMTLNELCQPGIQARIAQKIRGPLDAEVESWFRAKWELAKLEETK